MAGDDDSTMYVCNGYLCWRDAEMRLHRSDDLPAIVEQNGGMGWYSHGRPHRLAGPAIVRADGTKIWFQLGQPVKAEMGGAEYEFVDGKPRRKP
jgi:hypothetical protein